MEFFITMFIHLPKGHPVKSPLRGKPQTGYHLRATRAWLLSPSLGAQRLTLTA
jgi:hypothetical protein